MQIENSQQIPAGEPTLNFLLDAYHSQKVAWKQTFPSTLSPN